MKTRIAPESERRRWLVLAVTVAAQFMVIVDVAVVNVALPAIKDDLHFSQDSLQWVITAYSILFGGMLLLGGRLADLLGRRRLFMTGVAVFTLGSLLSGLAWSEGALIVTRGLQGLGGALLAPAALRSSSPPSARGVSATSPSASGAQPPASVAPSVCCSAACSRRT